MWQQHYTYDAYGNRYQAPAGTPNQYNEGLPWLKVESSDINPATNRYTLPGITYDAAGQITQDTYFRSAKYTYDANGRVRSWMRPDTTALQTSVTDGAGQRVRSITGSATATFIYDAFGRLCAEYDSRQPTLRSENIYRGAGGLLAVRATSTKQAVGGGYAVSVQWVLSDLAGSTRLTSGASGAVIARRDYTPFGEELGAGTGTRDTTQGYGGSFRARQGYAQTERDEGMELEHTPWRKLDAKAGRWTTPDPYLGSMSVGEPQSFNRYAYVQNDPVNFIDPSGLLLIAVESWACVSSEHANGVDITCTRSVAYIDVGGGFGGGFSPIGFGGGGFGFGGGSGAGGGNTGSTTAPTSEPAPSIIPARYDQFRGRVRKEWRKWANCVREVVNELGPKHDRQMNEIKAKITRSPDIEDGLGVVAGIALGGTLAAGVAGLVIARIGAGAIRLPLAEDRYRQEIDAEVEKKCGSEPEKYNVSEG